MDEKEKQKNRALYYTNLACMLADASETCLMHAECSLNSMTKDINQNAKRRGKYAFNQVKQARKYLQYFTDVMYGKAGSDIMCEDSDFLYRVILLAADRGLGNSDKERVIAKIKEIDAEHQFIEFIEKYDEL